MKRNGFVVLPVILIVIVVVALGGAFVYVTNQGSNSVNDDVSKSAETKPINQQSNYDGYGLDYSGPYVNESMGFGLTIPNGWAYQEQYSSEYYQYFNLYELDGTLVETSSRQMQLEVVTDSSSVQPCDRDACSELGAQDITVGSRIFTAETFSSALSSGEVDYKSFLINYPTGGTNNLTILGLYHDANELQQLKGILQSFRSL